MKISDNAAAVQQPVHGKKSSMVTGKKIAITGMLSAAAFVLMYLEIAVPLMPSFIKFDFSDLPAIIGSFVIGPVYGVIICLIKNLLHLAFSSSMFVGELSNFILGAIFVLIAGLIYKKHNSFKRALAGGITGAVAMGLFSIISNYFLVYPVYYTLMPADVIISSYDMISYSVLHIGHVSSILQCLIFFNLPFTIIKGLIDVGIMLVLYKPLVAVMRRL